MPIDPVQPETQWLTARELRALRGGSLRASQLLIRVIEQNGWCRVRLVASRHGRPTKLLAAVDYQAWLEGEARDVPANDDR